MIGMAAAVGASAIGARQAPPNAARGLAVAYPWSFEGGDKTSHETARRSADEALRKAGFATVGEDVARTAWSGAGLRPHRYRDLPSDQDLEAFGQRLHASVVLFGRVSWHTRSIWVDLGPKTISTAHVDAYVFDVAAGHTVYKKEGEDGRSDEPENGWKVAADVLITPLVTAVSGGPATPREERAVQIAIGKAIRPWVRGSAH
jgi:hypothetical protein